MIRQNKKLLLLTSVITLLPVFIGLFLWNQLPDSVATHFGLNNQPDGYSSKAFAVFGLPLILLAVHLVCVVATNIDPKSKDINKKNIQGSIMDLPVGFLVCLHCNLRIQFRI